MPRAGPLRSPVRPAPHAHPSRPRLPAGGSPYRRAPRDQVDSEALPAALELLDELALRGGWDLAKVTVKASSPETIGVVYAGHEFRVGHGNYTEKLRRLGEIVSDMNRRGLDYAYIELRPERQAAVLVKTARR